MFALVRAEIPVHQRDSPTKKLINSALKSADVPSVVLSMCPTSLEIPTDSLTTEERTNSAQSLTTNFLAVQNHEWHAESSPPMLRSTISRSRSFHLFHSWKGSRTTGSTRNLQSAVESQSTLTKSTSQSSLSTLLVQPQLINTHCPVVPPVPVEYSAEQRSHYERRQSELDRVVRQLIGMIERKTEENLQQIRNSWRAFKYSAEGQVTQRSQLLNYLLQSIYVRSSLPFSIEHNDDIHAAFQVLSTTLTIIRKKSPSINIADFFDEEEKQTEEQIREQLASLLASYSEEHQLITESLRYYQSRSNVNDWIRIIRTDYPPLIERVSNDFNVKVPSIEETLLRMLVNVKRKLLRLHCE